MPSLLNQLIYKETRKVFEESEALIFVDYNTFTQDDSVAIRAAAVEAAGTARVVKNSIAALVLKDLGYERCADFMKGPCLALIGNDPVGLSKAAADFEKKNKKGATLGGLVDGNVITAADVEALSKLPSKEALVGMFVNVVAAPLRGLVTVMGGNLRGLAQVLNAIKENKEKEVA